MGYGIMPVRINLARLSTRFGNTNSSKRSKARSACTGSAAEIDDLFGDDAPSYMEIVEELLDAKASHPGMGAKYWYAIKDLSEHLGRWLNNSEWYPANIDALWDIDALSMYDIDAPMDIPTPDDFPTVFTLRNAKMTDELVAQLKGVFETEEQYRQVCSWIAEAKRYKQDLLLFYH